MQFVRFSSLDNLLQQRPQNITHLVGCLKYICRATILIEAKNIFSVCPDVLFDRLDPPCNLLRFSMRDDPTLFDKLCGINSICFSVIVSESDVTLSGDNLECAVKKQTVVKLRSLQAMVQALLVRARELLSTLVPTTLKLNQPVDDDSNRTAGYSTFSQVANSDDIKLEINRRKLHQDFTAMQLYMRSAEELQKVLCMLYILTTGSPTRGVEMSLWNLANASNCQRNMYYDASKGLLYIKYDETKTSNSRQRDKMYFKFLSPDLTNVSMYYFGWVRPIEKFGARILNMPSMSISAFNVALFVFDGRASTSGDYSMLSRKFCTQYGIPPLGLRDLRQSIIGFSRAWLGEFSRFSAVRDYLEQFVALQAAHSLSTHKQRYGGKRPVEDIESFFVSSVSFMWLLGMDLPKIGMDRLPAFVRLAPCAGSNIVTTMVTAPTKSERASTLKQDSKYTGIQGDAFHKLALDLLKTLKMNPKATFRTNLQSSAVVSSLQRQEMLYIGPCGIGKSNIFMLPLFIEQATTALFLPYALVRRNVHLAAESMGITSLLLEMSKPINFSQPPRLLVCAVEQIRSISGILFELAKRNSLSRIVIDEIQCLFTEEFRSVMGEQQYWRAQLGVGVPLMFLSGSFRKSWESTFQECMGPGIPILREQTVLPNRTSYVVDLKPDHAKFYEFIMACYVDIVAIIDTKSPRPFKCMVFVPLVAQVQQVITTMQERFRATSAYITAELVSYTSKDPPEKQMASYQKWIRSCGVASVFVCTHAGAVGIDPPPDIKVYHLEAVWSIVSYFQAVGRSGRGCCDGLTMFITSKAALSTFMERNKVKKEDAKDVIEFLTTFSCKRSWLSSYFDATPSPPCDVAGALLCSSCKSPADFSSIKNLLKSNGVPPDSSLPARETRALSFAFSRGDQIVTLVRIFASFNDTGWCCLCYIFRRIRNKHLLNVCPIMNYGGHLVCFRCAGAHVSKHCDVSASLPSGLACFTCGCAFKVGIFDMHPFSQSCEHGARDRLQISCWYAKRNPTALTEAIKNKFSTPLQMSEGEFSSWLHKMDPQTCLPNNLRLFGELMEWMIRFNGFY